MDDQRVHGRESYSSWPTFEIDWPMDLTGPISRSSLCPTAFDSEQACPFAFGQDHIRIPYHYGWRSALSARPYFTRLSPCSPPQGPYICMFNTIWKLVTYTPRCRGSRFTRSLFDSFTSSTYAFTRQPWLGNSWGLQIKVPTGHRVHFNAFCQYIYHNCHQDDYGYGSVKLLILTSCRIWWKKFVVSHCSELSVQYIPISNDNNICCFARLNVQPKFVSYL